MKQFLLLFFVPFAFAAGVTDDASEEWTGHTNLSDDGNDWDGRRWGHDDDWDWDRRRWRNDDD